MIFYSCNQTLFGFSKKKMKFYVNQVTIKYDKFRFQFVRNRSKWSDDSKFNDESNISMILE
jgi:hypothetical protein